MGTINFHYSKIGYEIGQKKVALLSGDGEVTPVKFSVIRAVHGQEIRYMYHGDISCYGEKWNKTWYVVDFTEFETCGTFALEVELSDGTKVQNEAMHPIDIGDNILWNRTWHCVSLEQLDARRDSSYQPEGGWRDCGSPLQEASSHLIMIDSLCDLYECSLTPDSYYEKIYKHLIRGCDYVCKCQDKAVELGFGEGAVVHEIRENLAVSSGNCARVAVVFSRVSQILKDAYPEEAAMYLDRAIKAFQFISNHGPIVYMDDTGALQETHGAPKGFTTAPEEFMTRDLLSLCEAAMNFGDLGMVEYYPMAHDYAAHIYSRQVAKDQAEDGLYGHFYTFDSYEFTEKANLHCGAWNFPYKNYNQGAHMPFWILPLIRLANREKGTELGNQYDEMIRNFAYNFLLPATKANPFGIIPAGYYIDKGLLFFSGWYHGHNKIYGFAAKLGMSLYEYLGDEEFKHMATDNIQWIAGLNPGVEENGSIVSKSFIGGIGSIYHEDWNRLRGTIINGFDANNQFSIHPVVKELDLPSHMDDEGGIHHCSGFVSGISSIHK